MLRPRRGEFFCVCVDDETFVAGGMISADSGAAIAGVTDATSRCRSGGLDQPANSLTAAADAAFSSDGMSARGASCADDCTVLLSLKLNSTKADLDLRLRVLEP